MANSDALNRVAQANLPSDSTKYRGIYLSTNQIGKLFHHLKNDYNGVEKPDGLTFMIGLAIDMNGLSEHTVECIPYKNKGNKKREFFKLVGKIGGFKSSNLGNPGNDIDDDLFINNTDGGGSGISQKTPPPGA